MKTTPTPYSLTPFLAAFAVLIVAWFVPLPPIIAGEEAFAAQTIPTNRSNAQMAEQQFQGAQARYQSYVKTFDMEALLTNARNAIAQAKIAQAQAGPDSIQSLAAVKNVMVQINDYADVLHKYAEASERYFATLHSYDDKLMSWTRALGAGSESLRSATFPFVEHLKLYPTPVGEKADPPQMSAAQVAAQIASLTSHVAMLNPDPNTHGAGSNTVVTLEQIDQDVTDIWASGRSVEYVAGLHDDYYAELRTYDQQVQVQAGSNGDSGPTGGKRVLANALTALLGVVTFGGLAALFMTRPEKQS